MRKKQERRDASPKKPAGNPKSGSPKPGNKAFGKSFGKPYKPRLKKAPEDDGTIRLNKYIANAGICSRREADELIKSGLAEVNGKIITEMGYKVQPGDIVKFDGQVITAEKNVYILLNKPKGFITTTRDEKDRKTVMDLIANATTARVFPVGRLDRSTTGLLLFTNDGYLAKKLTHPSHSVRKIYHVKLNKKATHAQLDEIRNGIRLIPEGIAKVDNVSFIEGKPHTEVGIEIHIGWNRVVRRIFEKLDFEIESLDRVSFGGLTKKNLKRGDWRKLDEKEVSFLKML
ncbi:MAG: pseudouridine synthase [Weeksellaceae bacterium]|jgi:23S rRNA pseudouridine2605 synthase|nr:pseudouridine synthase [Weeksellaceae bacterium]